MRVVGMVVQGTRRNPERQDNQTTKNFHSESIDTKGWVYRRAYRGVSGTWGTWEGIRLMLVPRALSPDRRVFKGAGEVRPHIVQILPPDEKRALPPAFVDSGQVPG